MDYALNKHRGKQYTNFMKIHWQITIGVNIMSTCCEGDITTFSILFR